MEALQTHSELKEQRESWWWWRQTPMCVSVRALTFPEPLGALLNVALRALHVFQRLVLARLSSAAGDLEAVWWAPKPVSHPGHSISSRLSALREQNKGTRSTKLQKYQVWVWMILLSVLWQKINIVIRRPNNIVLQLSCVLCTHYPCSSLLIKKKPILVCDWSQ